MCCEAWDGKPHYEPWDSKHQDVCNVRCDAIRRFILLLLSVNWFSVKMPKV